MDEVKPTKDEYVHVHVHVPVVHDLRAQAMFKPQKDGTVQMILPPVVHIDPRDTVLLDPID